MCRVLSAVSARNPASVRPRANTGHNKAAAGSGANGQETTEDPLATVPCLFGLPLDQAREMCRSAGIPAVEAEVELRKNLYVKAVLSVAPCLGMTHGNPAMQGEVSLRFRFGNVECF